MFYILLLFYKKVKPFVLAHHLENTRIKYVFLFKLTCDDTAGQQVWKKLGTAARSSSGAPAHAAKPFYPIS